MVVAVFNTEENAFQGLTALKELDQNGDINLFATAVIAKDEEGNVEEKQQADVGPIGTSVGLLTGTFLGMLAGPVGMAAGAAAGMFGGMFYDLNNVGTDAGFVEEVSSALGNGKVAIVFDVEEGWTAPVDTKMADLEGIVFRRNKSEVIDDQLTREADAIDAELDELEHDLKEAGADAKASIQKQIDHTKEKAKALKEIADNKIEEIQAETKAKTDHLNEKMEKANASRKAKLEKKKAAFNEKLEKRKAKLQEVGKKVNAYFL